MLHKKKYIIVFMLLVSHQAFSGSKNSGGNAVLGNTINQAIEQNLKNLPVKFRKNMGQWNDKILFRSEANGINISFLNNGISYCTGREMEPIENKSPLNNRNEPNENNKSEYEYLVWNLYFEGANSQAAMSGKGMQSSKTNYLLGNDRTKWVIDAPDYSLIQYNSIYENIDLQYYISGQMLKYDYILRPHANIGLIKMKYDGIENLKLNESGQLEILTKWGTLLEDVPYSYQIINGQKKEIDIRYKKINETTFGFTLNQAYDRSLPIIIDPFSIKWGTHLGVNQTTAENYVKDMAIDNNGDIYLTGFCDFTFPVTPGAYSTANSFSRDAYVTKMNSTGTALVWSTYIGGGDNDESRGIAVNSNGEAFIAGFVNASPGWLSFPTTIGCFDPTCNSGDAFVARLNATGTNLIYSTFLGGASTENGEAISINNLNEAFVTGYTQSIDFPTQGAFDNAYNGSADVFVTKLSAAGNALIYSTYLGGLLWDRPRKIVTNNLGEAYVTGLTLSVDFPTLSAYDNALEGTQDAFVTKLNAAGNALLYSTYLGGSGVDAGNGIAINGGGEVFITGSTVSSNFPLLNAYDNSYNNTGDTFAAKLDATGNSLIYSTFIGGSDIDVGWNVTINAANEAYIIGTTKSANFPVDAGAIMSGNKGGYDLFFVHLNSSGNSLACGSTIFGGDWHDYSPSPLILKSGTADTLIFSATTHSQNLPTTAGSFQPIHNTNGDEPFVFNLYFTPCPTPTVSVVSNNVSCNLLCDGTAEAFVSGGIAPYAYLWTTVSAQTTKIITGLCAGTYSVIVTDANFDIVSAAVEITEPSVLTISLTSADTHCNQNDGTATATVSGGTTAYTFWWSDGSIASNISNLSSQIYSLTVTDANGCTANNSIFVNNLNGVTAQIISSASLTCNGICTGQITLGGTGGTTPYLYNWSNNKTTSTISGLCAGLYTATVTDATSCASFVSLNLSEPEPLTVSASSTSVTCNGDNIGTATAFPSGGTIPYVFIWSNGKINLAISNLTVGNYTVVVTDVNSCVAAAAVYVNEPTAITLIVSSTTITCNGDSTGIATAAAFGGTNPYTYNWNTGASSSQISNLASQIYTVTVTDNNGCTKTIAVTISANPGLQADAGSDVTINLGENTTLSATGGSTFSWSPVAGLSCVTCANPIASPTITTTYCVEVTDGNGCTGTACVSLTVLLPCGEIFVPTAFSPNSDDENDLECIFGYCIQTLKFTIYNRWGEVVFETINPQECWDGKFKEAKMNEGVFVYHINVTFTTGKTILQKGNITLVK